MNGFDNLTPEAAIDLRRELKRSRQSFGGEQTLNMQARLLARFRSIAAGTAFGHRHHFAGDTFGRIICLTVAPLLIFYDADTRDILRIVDGRRDLTSLFDEPSRSGPFTSPRAACARHAVAASAGGKAAAFHLSRGMPQIALSAIVLPHRNMAGSDPHGQGHFGGLAAP